jgi:hypothetical protein
VLSFDDASEVAAPAPTGESGVAPAEAGSPDVEVPDRTMPLPPGVLADLGGAVVALAADADAVYAVRDDARLFVVLRPTGSLGDGDIELDAPIGFNGYDAWLLQDGATLFYAGGTSEKRTVFAIPKHPSSPIPPGGTAVSGLLPVEAPTVPGFAVVANPTTHVYFTAFASIDDEVFRVDYGSPLSDAHVLSDACAQGATVVAAGADDAVFQYDPSVKSLEHFKTVSCQTLTLGGTGHPHAFAYDASASALYYVDASDSASANTIFKVDTTHLVTPPSIVTIREPGSNVAGLTVVAGTLYWSERDALRTMATDGTLTTLAMTSSQARFAVASDMLFYTDGTYVRAQRLR